MSKVIKLLATASIVFSLLLSGCASAPGTAHFLSQDTHSSNLYTAVVFGKVKINAGFELYEDKLFMALWRIDSEPDPSNINLRTLPFNTPENEERNELEVPFAMEVIPGTYDLRSVGLSRGSLPERIRFTPRGDFIDNDEKKGYHQIQHQIQIDPGEILYIGTLVIDINEVIESSLSTRTYKCALQFKDNFEKDSDIFKETFPSIFEKYKGKLRKHIE